MAVVPLNKVYVEANFKETQLTNVRIGQYAWVSADIYPGYEFTGKVAGIRAGTGAAFSLIPPENATGNWIKVVQRIPVRIELDKPPPPDHPLRVGASLDVTIDVADKSGPYLMQTTPAVARSPLSEKP
jgi:membrane fusion protein (multidrug efflux system)